MIKAGDRVVITNPDATGSAGTGIKAGEIYTVTKVWSLDTVQLDATRFSCAFSIRGLALANAENIAGRV